METGKVCEKKKQKKWKEMRLYIRFSISKLIYGENKKNLQKQNQQKQDNNNPRNVGKYLSKD